MSDRLLEAYSELDEFARSDDPQGYLTRFGEGVILLESFAREFNLDLPVPLPIVVKTLLT